MDMTTSSALTMTETFRPSGLVSVDGRTYPLKSARIEARAEGGVGFTAFTQTYGNPYQEPLEVLYRLPLPASGAVIGYSIRLGDRIIKGEVRKRSEAQQEYRKALVEGRTAALLEQDRADTFTQKLGCLPPGTEAEVRIEVLQQLEFLPGEEGQAALWEYRFPTVVGVRYEGAAGRVPDADRLDVDRAESEIPARLEAALLVADGAAASVRPQAPRHEIVLEDVEGGVRVTLKEKVRLDRDLVIRWAAAREEVGVRVVEGSGLACDKGRYILATITPPAAAGKGIARDLTLLIDASGSMSGRPLENAKTVAGELLRSLDPGDRFEILAFANDVSQLVPGPMEANEANFRKALAVLNGLSAGGGTEMAHSMVKALEPLRPDSQRQVILLSDGYIGFEGEVVGEVLKRLVPGARLHAVGIGSAPNRTLTRGVARAGRGIEILVGDSDDAKAASRRLLQATVRPVLTDLEVGGSTLVGLAPRRPQDVLEGQPLVLLGEISAAGGELEIRGKAAGSVGTWIRRMQVPARDAASGALPATSLPLGALFGREAIEDLEMQIAAAGRGPDAKELEQKIEALGLRHGIASRKTSLVAISENVTVNPRDPRRRERLPVELPADVSAEGVGLRAAGLYAPVMAVAMEYEPERPTRFTERAEAFGGIGLPLPKLPRISIWREERVPPLQVKIRESRILRVDGKILIVEFEVPVDGFVVPADRVRVDVERDDGTHYRAHVVENESCAPRPYAKGLTVRLALKLKDRASWDLGRIIIRWHGMVQPSAGESRDAEVSLELRLNKET
jgi:Ca-activated chloride channel family protein